MENTAKNFALQLGSIVTLYVSVVALTMLLFSIITIIYTDASQGVYEYQGASSTIRFSMALLVVFFPAYVILTRLVNTIRRREQGIYLALTKWVIYLSLIIGGASLLGDLVALINGFLNGELTIRFVFKILAFFIVVGSAFLYYVLDVRGHWQNNEKSSLQYATGVTVVVVASLILGFMKIESPAAVREMNIDNTEIQDLGVIQSRIESYYSVNASLPASLAAAYEKMDVTKAPLGRTEYSYVAIDSKSFKLCADFAYETSSAEQLQYASPYASDGMLIKDSFNWTHGKGNWCFTRVLNTQNNLPQVTPIK